MNYRYAEPFAMQPLLFLGTRVSAFGFESGFSSSQEKDELKQQYSVLYYDAQGEFIVKLIAANTTDEIVLTMLKKRGTFQCRR
ncbi:MAG: hypothetical protein QM762_18490 [Chryseolinea sp.]